MTAGLLETQGRAEGPAPQQAPDKWQLLRDLTAARAALGVSDRDLAVLSALLSFHPGRTLEDDGTLIVFPSNASLSERAHGMAESTLRRHLAALVRAGLILRRDSPNGKRYATRDIGGALDRVFGFDLRPLLVRSPAIAAAAEAARAEVLACRRLREAAAIRLRDAAKLIDWGRTQVAANWDALSEAAAALQRVSRRRLDRAALAELVQKAAALLGMIRPLLEPETAESGGCDSRNGRQHQNSDKDIHESEQSDEQVQTLPAPVTIPLALVLKAAPDIAAYARDGIRDWRDMVATADFVRPMLGIPADAWAQARRSMGDAGAATTLACILQRGAAILRPGGYLRALAAKARNGTYSPGPLVMALLRADDGPRQPGACA